MAHIVNQIKRHITANMGIKTDIVLYTVNTPNGIKVSILLEELGLEYQVRSCSL
jgi:glutathione S-transferase